MKSAPPILLAGELHNSSASSLAYLEPILDRLATMHLNAVLVPLSWELIEPAEGRYDFTLVDGIILAARQRGLRLVFLWFGTMKNAISSYTPAWVKTDLKRFFRAEEKPGQSSWTVSVFCEEVLRCDARAFAAVMRRIRHLDEHDGTVLMMQVENEPGILNAPRDLCPAAQAAFAQPVPRQILGHDSPHPNPLPQGERGSRRDASPLEGSRVRREAEGSWAAQAGPAETRHLAKAGTGEGEPFTTTGQRTGTWSEVFGADADEVFMAWHVARFVDQVAAAGQAEYDLPMFANAWLVAGPGYLPGQYPSGGPVPKMLEVWKKAAPRLAFLAPDIYKPEFRAECAAYHRPDNPLAIPETVNGPAAAGKVLYAVGRHQAILFAPFAIDDLAVDHPLAETYRLLADMLPVLAQAYGTDRLTGFLQEADEEKFESELGGYRFKARTRKKLADCRVPGGALLLQMGPDEFVVAGRNLILTFEPLAAGRRVAELVWLDTGDFHQGQWVPGRRLNGDETFHGTGAALDEAQTVCRLKLHSYS